MKLLSLHIENFGALHDVDEHFDSGLNVRLHPNGYGKSTLAVFIKSMLYGLPQSTRRSLIENERKRYTPWQGGAYGGSLDIEVGGHAYRIERLFGAKDTEDTLTVLSLETGAPVEEEWAARPGEALFGVGIAAFERSTYVSQRPDELTKEGMESIHTKLNGLSDAAHDLGNYDAAMAALESRRQHYALLRGRGGAVAESEDALAALEDRIRACEAAREALTAAMTRESEAVQAIATLQGELDELQKKQDAHRRAETARVIEDRLAATVREAQTLREQVEALRQGLGGIVPTEAMIDELSHAMSACEEARRQTLAATYDDLEAEELTLLRQRFAQGLPPAESLNLLYSCAKQYHEATILATAATGATMPETDAPEEQYDNCLYRLDEYQRQHTELTERRKSAERTHVGLRHYRTAIWCGAVALALLLSGLLWTPMLIAGGVAVLGAVICAVIGARRTADAKQAQAQALEQIDSEIAPIADQIEKQKALLAAAERGLTFAKGWRAIVPQERCPMGFESLYQTERLTEACRRLIALENKADRQKQSVREGQATLERAETAVRSILSGMPAAPTDAAQALLWLTEQRGLLLDCAARYEAKSAELDALRAQYDTTASDHREALSLADATNMTELNAQRESCNEKLREWSQARLREQQTIERLRSIVDEADELENERARRRAQLEEQRNNLDAIQNAEKYLKAAREHLSGRYLTTMQERFGYYMQLLTGKQAPVFTMDAQFRVKLRAAGAGRDAEVFSVGMRDLIAMCERFALLDTMFENERPFLVLDDPFTNLDDDTVARANELLAAVSERYQILYLTCHSSRTPKSAAATHDI